MKNSLFRYLLLQKSSSGILDMPKDIVMEDASLSTLIKVRVMVLARLMSIKRQKSRNQFGVDLARALIEAGIMYSNFTLTP